ncbi:uncharacterized protein F4807DRAFT_424276 [Annulohypoxylon truncatum]|uniref:uncharacterized protein n=1 Tax=Annulohypoxylon truncatum TaxID=327061 RepID=UPI00200756C1|nr:uncharacterized protein F4807DRAFT_424276 [Annulohypoxylon truncatum]KAI1210214.1 hypothetical protein F4807DRAFT_424276 [Annulohypoxylon truncatum]
MIPNHMPLSSGQRPNRTSSRMLSTEEHRQIFCPYASSGSRYIALSNCWVSDIPTCITTESALPDCKKRILWGILPKTIQ